MAIDPKYAQGPGGFYNVIDGSGPYSIASDGAATLIGASGGSGVTGGLTEQQLKDMLPMGVSPEFSASGNVNIETSTAGANFISFPDLPLKQFSISNDTDYTVEVQQDGSGAAYPVKAQSTESFFGITNANQLAVRRKDQVDEPLSVCGRWDG